MDESEDWKKEWEMFHSTGDPGVSKTNLLDYRKAAYIQRNKILFGPASTEGFLYCFQGPFL